MVWTQSARVRPFDIMVQMILAVRVDRMLAFTPLPSPSARTTTREPSSCSTISTWSPQSCSPHLLRLT